MKTPLHGSILFAWPRLSALRLWLVCAAGFVPAARATPPPLHQVSSTVYQTEHCLFIIDASVTWSSPSTAYNEIYGAGASAPYFTRLNGYFDTLLANAPGNYFSVCYIANTGDSHVPNYIDRTFKADGINESYATGAPYTFATVDFCRYNLPGGSVGATALAVYDHELGHAWGARAFYNQPGYPSLSDGHWLPNSTIDCQMGAVYSPDGGVTVDKLYGDPVTGFRYHKVDNGRANDFEVFSEQALYLLGARETWPTAYVLNNVVYNADLTAGYSSYATFDHAAMLAVNGPRTPGYTVSPKRFKIGFVYIARDLAEVNTVYANVEKSADAFCNAEAIDPVAFRSQTPFLCDTKFRASVDGWQVDLDGNATPALAVTTAYVTSSDGTAVINFTATDPDGPAPAVSVVPASTSCTVVGSTVQVAGLPDGVHFFSLKAVDTGGKKTFAHFTVEVHRPVTSTAITGQPLPVTATAGNPASFSVTASGSPATFTYQWFRQAARSSTWNALADGGAYAGTSTATLTVTTGTDMDGDAFECLASNSTGSATSSPAGLVVNETAPVLTTQPADATVPTGYSVPFTVAAPGVPATFGYFHYQWQLSIDGGTNWTDLVNAAPYTGCTTAAFRVTASLAMSGHQFRCVVSNTAGTVTSNVAHLTVGLIPVVTTQPLPVATTAGQTASFSVVVTGTGPLTYQWSNFSTPVPGGTGATLTLTNVQAADIGAYTVFVTNAYGSTRSNVGTLAVTPAAPTFTLQPQPASIVAGQPVTFTATPTGTAPFTYQWKKNGVVIPGATGATYTLAHATVADAGTYTVVVTNTVNSTTSNGAVLTVMIPTNAISFGGTTFPANVSPGGTVSFTYNTTNSGTLAWGASHYLAVWLSSGSYVTFPSLNGTAIGAGKVASGNFTAPSTPGTYTYYVQALDNASGFFGPQIPLTLTVTAPPNAISYATTTFPASVGAGGTVSFTYDVTNTGTQAWGANHYLAVWESGGPYVSFPSLNGIAVGTSQSVNGSFTAPSIPGTYTYYLQGLDNNTGFFGPQITLTLTVTAVTNAISYGTTTFPSSVTPGGAISFAYNVTNTGTQAWGPNYYLAVWQSGGPYLTFPSLNGTAAGAVKAASGNFTAPSPPGIYTYYVQALDNASGFFGPQIPLTLTVTSSPNAISYGSTTFPASVSANGTVTFIYNVVNTGTQTWGANHYLAVWESGGPYVSFPSLSGTAVAAGKAASGSFTAPATPGTYTYYVQALDNSSGFFGPQISFSLVVP